jgi:hypothetical protein
VATASAVAALAATLALLVVVTLPRIGGTAGHAARRPV